jgi:hypothetical protein
MSAIIAPGRRRLLNEIRSNLGAAVGVRNIRRRNLALLYEGCLWSVAWDAAKSVGAACTLRTPTAAATQVLLRAGPLELNRSDPYTFIEAVGRTTVQAHQGIYIGGLSTVRHQADLSIFPATATTGALGGAPHSRPRATQLIFGVEAKCYTNPLGVAIARNYLGLRADLNKRVALVTTVPEGRDAVLVKRHAKGIDVAFHEAAPGRQQWEELRRVIARHLRTTL